MSVGVYAWIGINFVLGRFEHIEDGKCHVSNKCIQLEIGTFLFNPKAEKRAKLCDTPKRVGVE